MYSRSERKFNAPDHDHANPNLGPGCYTADEVALVAGKTLGTDGYAPFASLTPRKSYFDEVVVQGPAPGAYESPITPLGLHNVDKAALFGRSRAPRFIKVSSLTPGPGSYVIPSSLRRKDGTQAIGNYLKPDVGSHIFAQEPGIREQKWGSSSASQKVDSLGDSNVKGDIQTSADSAAASSPDPVFASADATGVVDIDDASQRKQPAMPTELVIRAVSGGTSGPAALKKMSNSAKSSKDRISARLLGSSKGQRKKVAIVWRRKYIPPSIPVGQSAYGYKENQEGELIPRKPPKRKQDPGPAYNFVTSFVEKAKHENHGFTFGRDSKGLRFKIEDSPGPGVYDTNAADKYLTSVDTGNGPALMTLAPCTRMTDAIVLEAKKKGVPGPGAYDVKHSFNNPVVRPPGAPIPGFGASASHTKMQYICAEHLKTPGPCAYYPELASMPKPFLYKPQPFGSTTERFESSKEARIKALPAPGSYELDAIDSIVSRVSKRNEKNPGAGRPFGSVSERFPARMTFNQMQNSLTPGPCAYDVDKIPPPPPRKRTPARTWGRMQTPASMAPSLASVPPSPKNRKANTTRPKSRKIKITVGGVPVDPSTVRIPVFGSQTERFEQKNDGLPPPGAYEIAEAFNTVKNKGHIQISGLSGQLKRELFPAPPKIPGPGEYNVTTESRPKPEPAHGVFLSSDDRFLDKQEKIPGPGSYLSPEYDNGLLRKTFNITLGDWHNLKA